MKEKNKVQEDLMFNTMSDEQMDKLLAELADTTFWQAVLRFNRTKDAQAINSLASTDPFKDPTSMARTQGIRIGLYYIEQEINRKIKSNNEAQEETEAVNQ
jgi:hypothetical protein